MRPGLGAKFQVAHLLAFMALANVPDAPLPGWGHDLYYFSHSIFVNLLLIESGAAFLAFSPKIRLRIGGWQVIVFGALAWLSHLLLDTFYNHGKGVAMFWPLSLDVRLALPVPWFSVMAGGLFPVTRSKLGILSVEFLCYFPLIFLAIGINKIRRKKSAVNFGK